MPRANLEVLDRSMVALLDQPLTQSIALFEVFDTPQFQHLLRTPLSYSQGLTVDARIGSATASYQVESMRSQKTINLSTLRIEAHDRSGRIDLELDDLPETIAAVLSALSIEQIKAIGANYELTAKVQEGQTAAARAIAERLIQSGGDFLPDTVQLDGASVRLFLSDENATIYTIAVEPRFNDAKTLEVFLSCNAQIAQPELPPKDALHSLFQKGFNVLSTIADKLLTQE